MGCQPIRSPSIANENINFMPFGLCLIVKVSTMVIALLVKLPNAGVMYCVKEKYQMNPLLFSLITNYLLGLLKCQEISICYIYSLNSFGVLAYLPSLNLNELDLIFWSCSIERDWTQLSLISLLLD